MPSTPLDEIVLGVIELFADFVTRVAVKLKLKKSKGSM